MGLLQAEATAGVHGDRLGPARECGTAKQGHLRDRPARRPDQRHRVSPKLRRIPVGPQPGLLPLDHS
jgi:hypothetical protein